MAIRSAAGKIKRNVMESWLPAGIRGARNQGRGCDPRTESTSILIGSGNSKARGISSKPSRKWPAIAAQKGFASISNRPYIARFEYPFDDLLDDGRRCIV